MNDGCKFRRGDRVVRIKNDFDRNFSLDVGSTGTVVDIWPSHQWHVAGVLWDEKPRGGHSLGGRLTGEDALRGWNVRIDQIDFDIMPISLDVSEVL